MKRFVTSVSIFLSLPVFASSMITGCSQGGSSASLSGGNHPSILSVLDTSSPRQFRAGSPDEKLSAMGAPTKDASLNQTANATQSVSTQNGSGFVDKISYVGQSKTDSQKAVVVQWGQDIGRMTYDQAVRECTKMNSALPTRDDVKSLLYYVGGDSQQTGAYDECRRQQTWINSVTAGRFHGSVENSSYARLDAFENLSTSDFVATGYWVESSQTPCELQSVLWINKSKYPFEDSAYESIRIAPKFPNAAALENVRCVRQLPF